MPTLPEGGRTGAEAPPVADLLVVGEGFHGVQQLLHGGAQQAEGHGLGQVLGGQLEHAGGGYHLDMEGRAVALHRTQHQLVEPNNNRDSTVVNTPFNKRHTPREKVTADICEGKETT